MNLTKYSKNRLMNSFSAYSVPRDFAEPIHNYLVYGFSPGSFFTGMLENNFFKAMGSCHPTNTVEAIKSTTAWISHMLPCGVAWGSEEAVQTWLKMTTEERRATLESYNLIFTEKEEIIKVLKDEESNEPFFW